MLGTWKSILDRRRASDEMWASEFFSSPLLDLGDTNGKFSGILIPDAEIGMPRIGISRQFLEGAADYAACYNATEHFQDLIGNAIKVEHFNRPRILDVGTGSGANSVLPCLNLFEGCQIVATDLSPDLLAILRAYVERMGLTERVACVCTDATRNWFAPEKFDLVVGIGILHHLINPTAALSAARQALRPGGIAVFFEPFEGWGIVGLAFRSILDLAEAGRELPKDIRQFLGAMCRDFDARIGTDKSAERFQHMDDKWLFTRQFIEGAADKVGFRLRSTIPHTYDVAHHYRKHVEILMHRGGCGGAMPEWASRIIEHLDNSFSAEMKVDCPLEATIVLDKPGPGVSLNGSEPLMPTALQLVSRLRSRLFGGPAERKSGMRGITTGLDDLPPIG